MVSLSCSLVTIDQASGAPRDHSFFEFDVVFYLVFDVIFSFVFLAFFLAFFLALTLNLLDSTAALLANHQLSPNKKEEKVETAVKEGAEKEFLIHR